MDKNYLLQITNELYRLTLLFPKKEPLRYKIREVADEILADFVSNKNTPKEKLEILDGFFEVAKGQNWVKSSEILSVQKEYSKLKEELLNFPGQRTLIENKLISLPKQEKIESSDRYLKILEFLKKRGRAQVWEIQKIFPQMSKRTLRRDFRNLLKQGTIERIGERNDTCYQLKPISESPKPAEI